MRSLVVALTILLGVLRGGVAFACMNATMSDHEAIAKLKEAEQALDEGDVVTAQELAREVRSILWFSDDRLSPLVVRAARLEAIAHVRDREATPPQIQNATKLLHDWAVVDDQTVSSMGELPKPTPPLLADYGEALERNGQTAESYETLKPLADKDLIGSAYAYAALARASKAKDDAATATLAMTRCETMAVKPGVCRGEYPKRPFFRARPIDLCAPALLFLGLALVRLVRKKQPWSAYRAPVIAFVTVLVGALVFAVANARLSWVGFFLVTPLLFIGWEQRSQWLNAVRRGKVDGFEVVSDGEGLALVRTEIDPSYRESAKPPIVMRLPKTGSRRAATFAVVLLALFAGCAFVLFSLTLRG